MPAPWGAVAHPKSAPTARPLGALTSRRRGAVSLSPRADGFGTRPASTQKIEGVREVSALIRNIAPLWHPLSTLALLLAALPAMADDASLMRFPTLHGDQIVFESHGTLWSVDRTGGSAVRLTAEPGFELMPRFSPDGRWIAFTGE